jgi:predicted aminopeptidase
MNTTNKSRVGRYLLRGLVLLVATLGISVVIPGCGMGYVVRSAYFQAELLGSRDPVEKVRKKGTLSQSQLTKLDLIADVKAYGREIGLESTDNYETIASEWDRTIWNLSACKPLSLRPRTWSFPIVGKVPYLGFFRRSDADGWRDRLHDDGYETYLRTAGAYSTLGWFKDPILMPMLKWDNHRLAETVLHELAHATLWIKGSVKFNESFANFFGDAAAMQYMTARHGPESPQILKARSEAEDFARWREVLRALYQDLDALYKDESLADDIKLQRKQALFDALPERVAAVQMNDPARFERAAKRGPWNNARMMQYRTYNHNRDRFQTLLERSDGDLLKFIEAVNTITADAKDPFQALQAATDGAPAAR